MKLLTLLNCPTYTTAVIEVAESERGVCWERHTPPHFSPWAKFKLHWGVPTELTESRQYEIRHVEKYPDVFMIREGFSKGEYILIENRQPVGFDKDLPRDVGGLAIWHIDEKKPNNEEAGYLGMPGWPGNNSHYKVALVQADGLFDLERGSGYGDENDLFRGGGVDQISYNEPHGLRPYRTGPRIKTGATQNQSDFEIRRSDVVSLRQWNLRARNAADC